FSLPHKAKATRLQITLPVNDARVSVFMKAIRYPQSAIALNCVSDQPVMIHIPVKDSPAARLNTLANSGLKQCALLASFYIGTRLCYPHFRNDRHMRANCQSYASTAHPQRGQSHFQNTIVRVMNRPG